MLSLCLLSITIKLMTYFIFKLLHIATYSKANISSSADKSALGPCSDLHTVFSLGSRYYF